MAPLTEWVRFGWEIGELGLLVLVGHWTLFVSVLSGDVLDGGETVVERSNCSSNPNCLTFQTTYHGDWLLFLCLIFVISNGRFAECVEEAPRERELKNKAPVKLIGPESPQGLGLMLYQWEAHFIDSVTGAHEPTGWNTGQGGW